MKKDQVRRDIAVMLHEAFELEHAARIQYLSHAQILRGPGSEAIVSRLEEIAQDELKHQCMFRELIGSYLGEIPSMGVSKTSLAKDLKSVLEINLRDEKEAIDLYKSIYSKAAENKAALPYCHEAIEHGLRHIIIDEQDHAVQLSQLFGI